MDSFDNENDDKRGQQVRQKYKHLDLDLLRNFLLSQVLSSEVQTRVVEAFEVFDHENNKTVDVREVRAHNVKIIIINIYFLDWNHYQVPGSLPE